MIKKYIAQALEATRECLAQYWQQNHKYTESFLLSGSSWIGARLEEFRINGEQVRLDLEEDARGIVPCHLLQQQFHCVYHGSNFCIIAGKYLVTSDPDTKELLQEWQRCTFVWVLENRSLRLVHMHISNPIRFIEPGELFPHIVGQGTYQYFHEMLAKSNAADILGSESLQIKDDSNQIHFILLSDIEYAEAFVHYTIISAAGRIITAKIPWKEFRSKLPSLFIQTHRSYIVQKNYIVSLSKHEVILKSGKRIPVSPKRYSAICRQLSAD